MATPGAKALEMIRQYEAGNDVRQVISCSEGGRALRLLKRREENAERAATERLNIEKESAKRKFSTIDQKFGGSHADDLEEEFKRQTVGLISAEEFKAKRQAIDDLIQSTQKGGKTENVRLRRKVQAAKLSFDDDEGESDEEEEGDTSFASKRFGKDPTVNTAFLFDADREAEVVRKRKELAEEYMSQQKKEKVEKLEVTYSYWDGSGHRRSTTVEKGFTIGQFLLKSKNELEKTDFPELRTVALDNLMYVKEDLIIPHIISFYDLIKERAKGKSGPLFHFDVTEGAISGPGDIRVEKDESHAGKIVDRKWYERNKHIFPACRWEVYSKDKAYDRGAVQDGLMNAPNAVQSTLRG